MWEEPMPKEVKGKMISKNISRYEVGEKKKTMMKI